MGTLAIGFASLAYVAQADTVARLATDTQVQPSLPEPTAQPVAEPVAEPTAEPVAEPNPEPNPERGTPVPETIATPSPRAEASDDERAPGSDDDDDDDDERDWRGRKIERAEAGHWGMQFTFGGLAPLSIAGIRDHGVNRLLLTELGFRYVADKVIVPFSIGAGVFRHSPDEGSKQNDAGVSASVGVLRPFRVWRRISPYFGGMFHLHYLDPTGDNNWLFNVSVGPVIGTEFYVGDRVSLLFQGQVDVGINVLDGATQVRAATSLAAGGQTGLVFYF